MKGYFIINEDWVKKPSKPLTLPKEMDWLAEFLGWKKNGRRK